MSDKKEKRTKSTRRNLIEWGAIIAVGAILYLTGLHTEVIGTLQRGLLATGLIKPSIPEVAEEHPPASMEFYFADENSSVQSLAAFEGDVIFLNIWASWCPPCIAEMPSIQNLYNDLKETDGITFLLVSVDEDFERAKGFMERREFEMPIYHFRTKQPGTYESTMIPTTYVISPNKRLVLEKRGFAKYDTEEFKTFLKDLAES
jgi:thiol-disulfide isomerase/thioredoxin